MFSKTIYYNVAIIRYCIVTFNANFLKILFYLQCICMNNLKSLSFLLCIALITLSAKAQKSYTVQDNLRWEVVKTKGATPFITFDKATTLNVASAPIYYSYTLEHGFDANINVNLTSFESEALTPDEMGLVNPNTVTANFSAQVFPLTLNRKPAARIVFIPLIKDPFTGQVKKITSFTLQIDAQPSLVAKLQGTYVWKDNSVLQNGKWVKATISKTGVYALSVKKLTDAGLSVDGVDINTLHLYGNGGGMLPQPNSAEKTDDLIENPIAIKDINQNGKFDGSDYIYFYAEGPNIWEYDTTINRYAHKQHAYATNNAYYITVGASGGKRIATQPEETGNINKTTANFDELYVYENDLYNKLRSGREWLGEEFDRVKTYDFKVDIADIVPNEQVLIQSQAVGSSQDTCWFVTSFNGTPILTQGMHKIHFSSEGDIIDTPDTAFGNFTAQGSPLNIRYTFSQRDNASKGWLNFFEIIARRQMKFNGGQVIFRDSRNVGNGNFTEFVFNNNNQDLTFWEVTNPINIKQQQTRKSGQENRFTLSTSNLRHFVAFNENTLLAPDGIEFVENQNLHGLRNIDMVIIAHPDFMDEAKRLAEYHEKTDGLKIALVTPKQIYEEFSSGKQDVTAIRNFMKMLYDRPAQTGDSIKYLLLFGDASYDYKDKVKNNTNYVPTYQSRNYYNQVLSYCSDDYFGLLDDNEGEYNEEGSNETVDIGIGRFPVQTAVEAQEMVDKVIRYDDQKTFGSWRNGVCFMADDEDSNIHFKDGEAFSKIVENAYPEYNVDKIYLDAYKQVSVGNGARYPEVVNLLNRKVAQGSLIINYNGHGGELGLTEEQILDVPMINAWDNKYNMPLFITATCEFSRFDDPGRTSAGELVLLNPNGGGIALLTTVRLVYQYPNHQLNEAVYKNNIFDMPEGHLPRLGDIYRITKNGAINLNSRNFTLLGDPAITLAYPNHQVVTTEINGSSVGQADTAGALSKVTIKGEVQDKAGNTLTGFNGVVYPTVFDKESQITTLANDPTSIKAGFKLYKNIIYKGKSSVTNGQFEFSFVVPQDISYALGNSKISYYATNNIDDAHGYYDSLIVTGTDKVAPVDVDGPTIRLFMNDTTFRYGGETDQNPTLLALVSDLHGINTTGNGIGRDLTAILDADRKDVIILNDYYQATLNSYQSGEIRYPLKNLSEGFHNIRVKVWDVYNNSAEGYTEFFVASSEKLAIKHLMNYPNPFKDKTVIYFEHNRQGQEMNVDVDIYSLDGKLIKTLSAYVPSAGANFDGLEWNVANDYDNNIAQGIYLFRVKVRSGNDTVEETQKMVFIK
jgi:hypothetical protein